jgi:hypothetical protein
MKVTPETKTYIILGLTVSCMVAIVFSILLPTVHRMQNVRLDIDNMKDLLEKRYTEAQRMHKANVTVATIKDQVQAWEGTLVTPETELQFINFLEGLAKEKGVEIKIKVNPEPSEKPFIKNIITLDIEMTGSFEPLLSFLRALDQSDYYVSTKTLSLEGAHSHTATSDNPFLVAKLKSTLYVY